MSTLSHKTIKNSIYSLIGFVWPLILAFVSVPILIRALGTSQYGFLILLNTSIGFFSLLDLGFNYSFTKKLSENYEQPPDVDDLNKMFSSTYITYFALGILVFFILIFFTPLITSIFKIPHDYAGSLPRIFFVLGLTFFFKMLIVPTTQIPYAIQRSDVVTKISMVNISFIQIASIVLAVKGFGVFSLMLVQLVSAIAVYLAYHTFARRALPYLRLKLHFSFITFRSVIKDGVLVTVGNFFNTVVYQLDKIVLGVLSGPSAVSYYASSQMIPEKIQGTCFSLSHLFFPIFSQLQKNDADKVSAVFRRSIRISILITAVLTVLVLIYGYSLIFYWLGSNFADKTIIAVYYLAFTYFILSINMFIHFFLAGTKRLKTNVVFGFIIAVVDVIFMLVLIPKYQVTGAAMAFLISSLPVPLFLYYVENKYLSNGTKDIVYYYGRHMIEVILVGIIVYFVSRLFLVPLANNLFVTVVFGMLSFILYFFIYYLFGFFKDQDRYLFKEFGVKILSKIKSN